MRILRFLLSLFLLALTIAFLGGPPRPRQEFGKHPVIEFILQKNPRLFDVNLKGVVKMMIERKLDPEQTEVRLLTEHTEPVCRMNEPVFSIHVNTLSLILEPRGLRRGGAVKLLTAW